MACYCHAAVCDDDDALCTITNAVPSEMFDFRNHSRVVVGSKGVVAADQSRCSDIGAAVLQVRAWTCGAGASADLWGRCERGPVGQVRAWT